MSTLTEIEPITEEMLDAEIGCEITITTYWGFPDQPESWEVTGEKVCGRTPVVARLRNLCPCSEGKLSFVCRRCLDNIEAGNGGCIACHEALNDWKLI